MVQHMFRCRQPKLEINIFFLQFVGFSIDVAELFVFAGTNGENPVPDSSTKILTVKLGSYTLIFLTTFGFNIIQLYCNCKMCWFFFKA